MRADAQQNVAALLDAAKAVFASSGVDAPAKEITDLAGVGVGTLYRHFARRSDLIVAVMQNEIDECIAAAQHLGATLGPWDALLGSLDRFIDFVGTKSGLGPALHSGDPAYDGLPSRLLDQFVPAFDTLLKRAVDAGCARDDVTAREVLLTVALLCRPAPVEAPARGEQPARGGRPAHDEQPSVDRRMAEVFIAGLAAPAQPAPARA